jgi:hypothetical protein
MSRNTTANVWRNGGKEGTSQMTKDELITEMKECAKHKGYMVSIPHATLENWLDTVIELLEAIDELHGCTRWGTRPNKVEEAR